VRTVNSSSVLSRRVGPDDATLGLPPTAVQASACTCFKLRSLARRVTQLYDQTLAPSGLKVTQYAVIGHARRRDGAVAPTVSELALALVTDRTTLTRNLKPLVDAGYLKVGSGADARSKAVCVTPKGEAVYQSARPLWKLAQLRMRDLAGAGQLTALHEMIETMLPQLDAADQPGN
jgi:DNA-binding MarR family transcriptional regulator